ncbi:MAG: glycosyltransferase family 2 protein [Gammaproteobacteria bacterium]|nr:glycosyltransferase family 2 protein [Gammaproteobacteria bacterium]
MLILKKAVLFFRRVLKFAWKRWDILAYQLWILRYDRLDSRLKKTALTKIEAFHLNPVISVVMVGSCKSEKLFYQSASSVIKQLYSNWELIVLIEKNMPPLLVNKMKKFATQDHRIKIIDLGDSRKISSECTFLGLMMYGDSLTQDALYQVVQRLQHQPNTDIFYSDHDHLNRWGMRCKPYFKGGFDPYLIVSRNELMPFCVVRKTLLREEAVFCGTFNGVAAWDFVFHCVEKTNKIFHIPHILYHQWQFLQPISIIDGQKVIEQHLQRCGIAAEVCNNRVVYALPAVLPFVSIIIPTKDGLDMLRPCIESIFATTEYANLEVIIVNNNSQKSETLTYFEKIRSEQIKIVSYPGPFNFSKINNFAVQQAKGEILLFLNNDIEAIEKGWFESMLSMLLQKNVGIVGAKLYYADERVQHAGVVLEFPASALHVYAGLPREQSGYFGKINFAQCCSAVTGACLMMTRSLFEQIGGFDESFPVTWNDADLCTKVRQLGYVIVYDPAAQLYHKESGTRGRDTTPEKRALNEVATRRFFEKWSMVMACDPHYNPNLSLGYPGYYLAFVPRGLSRIAGH